MGKEWKKVVNDPVNGVVLLDSGLYVDCKKKTHWADSKLCTANQARDYYGYYTGQYPCPTDACPIEILGTGQYATWSKKTTKIVFNSERSVIAKVNFPNLMKPEVDLNTDNYNGFIVFTKAKCGADFLNALDQNDIVVELFDYEFDYHLQYGMKSNRALHKNYVLQFYRKSKGERDLGFTKKDQVYMYVYGVHGVNYTTTLQDCIHGLHVATLPINPMIPGGAEANYADCVGNDKDLGWEGKE